MEQQPNEQSIIRKLILFWRGIPKPIRGTLPVIGLSFLKIMLIFVGAIFIASMLLAPLGAASEIAEYIAGLGEAVIGKLQTGWQSGINWVLGYGFNTDEEAANEKEEKFYYRLEEVKETYREKYNVEIDTVLITATLFFERDLGETTLDSDDFEEPDTESEFGVISVETFNDKKKFFRNAYNMIDTLASYQVVEYETTAECVSDNFSYDSTPEGDYEIATAETKNIVNITIRRPFNKIEDHIEEEDGLFVECSYDDVTNTYIDERNRLFNEINSKQESVDKLCQSAPIGGNHNYTPMSNLDRFGLAEFQKLLIRNDVVHINSSLCVSSKAELNVLKGEYDSLSSYFDSSGNFLCNPPFQNGDGFDGCALLQKTGKSYQLSIQRDGVYYNKLAYYKVKNNQTVLENIYPDVFKTYSGLELEEKLVEVTEEIYDFHASIVDVLSRYGLMLGEFFSIRVEGVDDHETSSAGHSFYWTNVNRFYVSGVNSLSTAYPYAPGQCTTYAYGRVKEIEAEIGYTCGKPFEIGGNAFGWFGNAEKFNGSSFNNDLVITDIQSPRPGSLIIWSDIFPRKGFMMGDPGHVAVIEKVYYNDSGKLVVDYSQGNAGRPDRVLTGQYFSYVEGIEPSSYNIMGGLKFAGYINPFCL